MSVSSPSKLFVYDGSKLLEPLTNVMGIPIDQVNFLFCQLVAVGLGWPYRMLYGPHKTTATVRHIIQLLVGLPLAYFCFGRQVWHILLQTLPCFLFIKFIRPGIMEKVVFVWSMGYLCMCHIYRLIYDYGGYTLDITGPLMINTQRVSSLAFSILDGTKDEKKLSPTMKKHAISKFPSMLESFSYIFSFHGMMCGPFVFFKDYIQFIDGTNYKAEESIKNGPTGDKRKPPAPGDVFLKKFAMVVICGVITVAVLPKFTYAVLHTEEFAEWILAKKMGYIMLVTSLTRFQYYFGWKMGELANVNSGLGYYVDEKGGENWDLIDNADIWKVETCTSLKVLLDSWNKTTTYWLRYVIYERTKSTMLVFMFSAFWHGFYAGYYITFISGAIFIHISRLVRRNIRPLFQTSSALAFLYDCITFVFTRISIAYLVFPHVLFEAWLALGVYVKLRFFLHILAALVVIGIMAMKKMTKRPREKGSSSQTNGTKSVGVEQPTGGTVPANSSPTSTDTAPSPTENNHQPVSEKLKAQ